VKWLIDASCVTFIVILVVSAVFDPRIRVLHVFEAFIYVAVMVWARQRSAWGYGAGFSFAAFWNWTNFAHTTFIANGMRALEGWIQSGHLQRPDQLIAVPAAAAHFVLIAACIAGYFLIPHRTARDAGKFWASSVLVVAYFVAAVVLTGPQYIPLIKRVFGVS